MRERILVIGQTPPPYGGQSLMIRSLVNSTFSRIEVFHVRMHFSESFSSVGKFHVKKLLHVVSIVYNAIVLRVKYKVRTLYYPVAGPSAVPVFRDALILTMLRPFFPNVVFHFHAAGLAEYVRTRPYLLRQIVRRIYWSPDGAIQLSNRNAADSEYFNAKKIATIPNGIEDCTQGFIPFARELNSVVRVLFVGLLTETKGVFVLLEALNILKRAGKKLELVFVGQYASHETRDRMESYCKQFSLEQSVSIVGEKVDNAKWDEFQKANLFCFPTFFEAESFGNVLLEAMMFELPVVATNWRGIPDIVQNGVNGYLVPVRDAAALASKMALLSDDADLRIRLGKNGRKIFLDRYAHDRHLRAMEAFLFNVISSKKNQDRKEE